MKKIFSILAIMVLAITAAFAQDAEMMQKAMERFKGMNTLTANVTQTKHNTMVAKDITSKGNFYFKKPNKMCMTFNEGKDMMLMNGESFTIVKDGVRNTAQSGGNEQLQSLTAIIKNFSAGQETDIDLSDARFTAIAVYSDMPVTATFTCSSTASPPMPSFASTVSMLVSVFSEMLFHF